MNGSIKLLWLIICLNPLYVSSQSLDNKKINDILDSYNRNLEQFIGLSGCGHFLDGPAYTVKKMENASLDFVFEITASEESELREKTFSHISSKEKILIEHWALDDLNSILASLVENLDTVLTDFKVFIIDSESVNAFATMGGDIYVNTGLLELVDSQDELAFILGHEISHYQEEHIFRKSKKLMIVSDFFNSINFSNYSEFAINIGYSFSAPFDQIDEYEADKMGAILAKKAGYDASKFDDFFDKMIKYQKKDIFYKITSTHPYPEDRKKCLADIIEN